MPDSQRVAAAVGGAREIERVDVLGVGVSAVTRATARDRIAELVEEGERGYVCVTGVHGVMESQDDPELLEIHNRSALTVPDGVPMVWCGRFAGAESIERVYGPDLMIDVCRLAAERGWKSFLYGGSPRANELLAGRLPALVPGLVIGGRYSPPFRTLTPAEDQRVRGAIDESGARLVWVGLSTPRQERWMADHVGATRRPTVMFGVGAAFDIHAGLIPDAPHWVRPIGLHWLYRLIQEPRRLAKRYAANNPRFVLRILRRPPRLRPADPGRR